MIKNIAYNALGLGFDSKAGQIKHHIAIAAMFLGSCVAQTRNRGDGCASRYTLQRNTAAKPTSSCDLFKSFAELTLLRV